MWRKISYADKGNIDNQLTTLSIPELWPSVEITITSECKLKDPKKSSTWRKLELPEEILHYLKACNRHHFGQAHGTPFTVPPLSQIFDWAANSAISKLVLKGECSNEELSELQQLLLKHCKAENYDQLVGMEITRKVWKRKVTEWRESTTTASLGQNLGHFKILLQKFKEDPDAEEGKEMTKKQNDLIDTYLGLMNYAHTE
eukprot:15353454-Ditylum_brightwellii.AAC.1